MLVFDFDGVLFDSHTEVLISAFNAITGELHTSVDTLPAGYVRLFHANCFRPRNASQMLPLGRWCREMKDSGENVLSARQFRELLERETETAEVLRKQFFQARSKFLELDPGKWAELSVPYEPLWSKLILACEKPFAVLTNKNSKAVRRLFENYGSAIPEEIVFGGDLGYSKSKNFELLKECFAAREYTIVEDSVDNLIELKRSNPGSDLEFCLAAWGYVAPEDYESARKQGIKVISQEDLL